MLAWAIEALLCVVLKTINYAIRTHLQQILYRGKTNWLFRFSIARPDEKIGMLTRHNIREHIDDSRVIFGHEWTVRSYTVQPYGEIMLLPIGRSLRRSRCNLIW